MKLPERGPLAALIRLILMVTAPIWLLALLVLYLLCVIFIDLPYWLWTGEEL